MGILLLLIGTSIWVWGWIWVCCFQINIVIYPKLPEQSSPWKPSSQLQNPMRRLHRPLLLQGVSPPGQDIPEKNWYENRYSMETKTTSHNLSTQAHLPSLQRASNPRWERHLQSIPIESIFTDDFQFSYAEEITVGIIYISTYPNLIIYLHKLLLQILDCKHRFLLNHRKFLDLSMFHQQDNQTLENKIGCGNFLKS